MVEYGARAKSLRSGSHGRAVSKACRVFGIALVIAMAGCARNPSPMDSAQWRVAGPAYQLPREHVAPARSVRRIVEDDGIEEQAPPLVRQKPVADDPSEPFSPNYGSEPIRQGSIQPTNAYRGDRVAVAGWVARVVPTGGRTVRAW